MPSRINRVPQGLQDLLGSQNFGDNPSQMATTVAPILDMMPFYYAQKREYVVSNVVNVVDQSDAGSCVINVPSDEIWFVRGVGTRVQCNGTDAQFRWHTGVQIGEPRWYDGTPVSNVAFADCGWAETATGCLSDPVWTSMGVQMDFEPVFGGEFLEFNLTMSNFNATASGLLAGWVRFLRVKI